MFFEAGGLVFIAFAGLIGSGVAINIRCSFTLNSFRDAFFAFLALFLVTALGISQAGDGDDLLLGADIEDANAHAATAFRGDFVGMRADDLTGGADQHQLVQFRHKAEEGRLEK